MAIFQNMVLFRLCVRHFPRVIGASLR